MPPIDLNAAKDTFLAELQKDAKADVGKLEAFAIQYGPTYAYFKAIGDEQHAGDLLAAAVNESAVLEINAQANAEQLLKNALDLAAGAAIKT